MKKNVGILLLMLAFAVLSSCGGKKDDKEAPEPTTGQYLVTVMELSSSKT